MGVTRSKLKKMFSIVRAAHLTSCVHFFPLLSPPTDPTPLPSHRNCPSRHYFPSFHRCSWSSPPLPVCTGHCWPITRVALTHPNCLGSPIAEPVHSQTSRTFRFFLPSLSFFCFLSVFFHNSPLKRPRSEKKTRLW